MTTPKELGKIFTEAREERRLSVAEAAKDSRIHPNVVRDIENGVFDRLGKLYVKSFMKKYAAFLGLDTDRVLAQYEAVSSKVHGREYDLAEERGRKDEAIDPMSDKRLQVILVGVLTVILIVLVFVFIGMMRSRISARPRVSSAADRTAAVTQQDAPAVQEKPASSSFFAPKRTTSDVTLTLRATGESWIQINKGDEKIFAGFLKEGQSRSWTSDQPLTVWTGKADNLIFIVNTRKVGVIASGVVKNIVVSSEGVRVGDDWVARLK